jgi:hypothetical protein
LRAGPIHSAAITQPPRLFAVPSPEPTPWSRKQARISEFGIETPDDLVQLPKAIKQSIQDLLIATVQKLRKLIGAIQNASVSTWKLLTRNLLWLCVMRSAYRRADQPRQRILASDLPLSLHSRHWQSQLFGQQAYYRNPKTD